MSSSGMIVVMLFWAAAPFFELRALSAFVDAVTRSDSSSIEQVKTLITYLIWGLVVPTWCWTVYYHLFDRVRLHAQQRLAIEVLTKAGTLRIRDLETPAIQDVIRRAGKIDTGEVLGAFLSTTFLVTGILRVVAILGILASFSVTLFVIVCILAIPSFIARNMLVARGGRLLKTQAEQERLADAILGLLFDRRNADELDAYQSRERLGRKWLDIRDRLDEEVLGHESTQVRWSLGTTAIRGCGELAVLVGLAILISKADVELGAIAGTVVALGHLQWLISAVTGQTSVLVRSQISLSDLNQLFHLGGSDDSEFVSRQSIDRSPPSIEFRNVSYQYPGTDQKALSQANFSVRSGESAVFVGENGSGKSTALRLLLGLDEPSGGQVRFGSQTTGRFDAPDSRRASIMFQDPTRYEIDLRTNVGISDFTQMWRDDAVMESLEFTGIRTLALLSPRGLDLPLGPDLTGGVDLSGGQWQRLGLARAHFRKGTLLVLDEPNSAIDPFEEARLYARIMALAASNTAIIVSHRLPIARLADKIVVFEEGRVVEVGSHDELLQRRNGVYQRMFRAQAGLYGPD